MADDTFRAVRRRLRSPGGIVLVYAVFAGVWIAGSDRTLSLLFRDPEQFRRISTMKGMLFIAVTGMLLYLLLRAWQDSLKHAFSTSTSLREQLERVLKGTNDGWWEWDLKSDRVHYSPRCSEMLGYAPGTLPPDSGLWRTLTHPDDLAHAEQVFAEAFSHSMQSCALEARLRHRDGHYVPILSRFSVQRDADDAPVFVSGSNMDLTERKRTDERLREAAAVFETTREAVMVTDAARRITMVNHAFSTITGYTEAEVMGRQPGMLASGRHDADFFAEIGKSVDDSGYWQGEIWNRRKDGDIYPALLSISSVTDSTGALTHYVGVFADISRLKASETRAEFLTNHDSLTQLPNRLLLLSYLDHAIRAAQRDRTRVALLVLDLDRFKDVNDSFGHGAGDELLQQVGARLAAHLHGMDAMARLGGDEFAVMLPELAREEDAALVASAILSSLGKPWRLSNGAEVRIGASIGISLYPEHGTTTHELLQHADAALYQAKQEGRGCFRYFAQHLTHAARARIDLEARLHRAIEQDELRVFYQPLVDVASGRIVGAEALVRWQDPHEGLIAPARFIPLAESTGLINDIGAWVLRETCRQGSAWIASGLPPLTLAVNLSPRQLLRGDIAQQVAAILAETGFPATRLELELTESALMEREQDAVQLLNRLRATGVRLAIDDFGTGYSSLANLHRFPLDVLKIDKSFIDGMPGRPDGGAIASAIVAMGHKLGFKVLAEGVEQESQLAFLKSLGCDLYQGYLRSRPVPAEAFEELVLRATAES